MPPFSWTSHTSLDFLSFLFSFFFSSVDGWVACDISSPNLALHDDVHISNTVSLVALPLLLFRLSSIVLVQLCHSLVISFVDCDAVL